MPEVWGRPGDPSKLDQDVISDPANHNVLQVNTDVGEGGGADKIAIHAVNLNAGAGARALKVEGKAEIVRNAADEIALQVTNTSADDEARALKVTGKAEFGLVLTGEMDVNGQLTANNDVILNGITTANYDMSMGSLATLTVPDVNDFNEPEEHVQKTALSATNTGTGVNDRALEIEGSSAFDGPVTLADVNDDSIVGLKVANTDGADAVAFEATGQ